MLNMALTIIAIALSALSLYSSINYQSPFRDVANQTYNLANNGFTNLSKAFTSYKNANGVAPGLSTWQADLTPTYTFMPRPPLNMTWSYGTDNVGYYFCLSGSVTQAQFTGLDRLNQIYSAQQYFENTNCGATANTAAPTTFPANLAVTYWVTAP